MTANRAKLFRSLLAGLVLFLGCSACAEVKLDFWHSYTHQPSGVVHYSFQIASYKRGLFFGSCGPSTRSLQWEYDIDLAGTGPAYQANQIVVTSEGKPVQVINGTITVGQGKKQAVIVLRVKLSSSESSFQGNGTFRIEKLR
jgi:hypothetical protein